MTSDSFDSIDTDKYLFCLTADSRRFYLSCPAGMFSARLAEKLPLVKWNKSYFRLRWRYVFVSRPRRRNKKDLTSAFSVSLRWNLWIRVCVILRVSAAKLSCSGYRPRWATCLFVVVSRQTKGQVSSSSAKICVNLRLSSFSLSCSPID